MLCGRCRYSLFDVSSSITERTRGLSSVRFPSSPECQRAGQRKRGTNISSANRAASTMIAPWRLLQLMRWAFLLSQMS